MNTRPLRVLITRARAQARPFAQALQQAGHLPFFLPVIEIRPVADHTALDLALSRLGCYDWLLFTSVNAVEMLWQRPALPNPLPAALKVAAIGAKTAASLRARAIEPDFIPTEFVSTALLPGLGDLRGRLLLLPAAEIARQDLPNALVRAGAAVHQIAVYQTLPVEPDPHALAALRAGLDVITLASPSAVENFCAMLRAAGLNPACLPGRPLYACIGPVTQQAALEAGLPRPLCAPEYTVEGLLQVIQSL